MEIWRSGEWSEADWSVWGKTEQGLGAGELDGQGWLPLVQHLEDARCVAGHVWDTWVSRLAKRRLADELGGEHAARTLYAFLAGVHDCGKATPAFAQLAHDVGRGELVSRMEVAVRQRHRLILGGILVAARQAAGMSPVLVGLVRVLGGSAPRQRG